jgi:AcrR family transcriptional regulator
MSAMSSGPRLIEAATPTGTEERVRRSDARRNHERVFAAALEIFDELGLQGTIPQIAERAGIGKGTVYRSYPTKEDLVAAVTRYRLAEMERSLAPAKGEADPYEAFSGYVIRLFEGLAGDRLLSEVLAEPGSVTTGRILAELATLLAAAKSSGQVRSDATELDLNVMLCGAALMLMSIEQRDPALWRRYAELTLRALRPD